MSYFIVINGPLGCGKTTNAKKLASFLNGKYVSLDQLLKDNNLEDIEPDAGIRAGSFIKALDIILPDAKRWLEDDTIVIFDGCFYHKEVLDHLLNSLDFSSYVFTLKAPVEVCIERDKARKQTLGEDAAKAVHNLVSQHNFGDSIDASKSLGETFGEIVSLLPKT